MQKKQYLTFSWHDLQYGIEAALVQEIFLLPELIIIPAAPTDILGLLNLRGQLVPIIPLAQLPENFATGCHIDDYVIVLQWDGLQIGIVVHQVKEVRELNSDAIQTEPSNGLFCEYQSTFDTEIIKVDTGKIILIEPKTLISQVDAVLPLIWDAQIKLDVIAASPTSDVEYPLKKEVSQQDDELQSFNILSSFYDLYCPDATSKERAIFRQRADNLKQTSESLKITNELIHLAVVGFGNEYFGLDLELVREFTNIRNLMPIPSCPNHIVGNMNLRGEIVTLVDIRGVLNLPTVPVSVGSQAVVVQVDDIVAGLPVDRVLEMVELNSADLTPLPTNLPDLSEQYLQGTTFFQEKMLRVLDLPKIFTQGGLVVNEEA